jgi:hypothetical protein
VSLAVVARDPVPESEAPGAGSLTVLDSLEASLILTLRWFEAGRSNAPLFVYDDLFESDEWERMQNGVEGCGPFGRRL